MTRSQTNLQVKKEHSSPEVVAPSSKKPKFVHRQELINEAMPVYFPPGLPEISLDYLVGDIDPTSEDKKTEKCYVHESAVTLFGRSFSDLMHPDAALVANLILRGEEKDVKEALTLIKKNPDLLRYHTLATDPLGRQIKGTPLQIAAIAGDMDLKEGIQDEKDRGMVERLIAASNLSKEEVANQLECITSIKAKQINEKRNQRILSAIIRFGEAIIESKADNKSFETYQAHCKPLIDQLEKDLQPDSKDVVNKGYVFDPKILHDAMKWFEDNVKRFGGWWSNKSDVFWVNGIGKLQSRLSSRDAQVIRAGIGDLVDNERLPARTLNNSDGLSYFFNTTSRLGKDFYLGYYVDACCWACRADAAPGPGLPAGLWKLMSSKNSSITKLMQCPGSSNDRTCLIM
jgi:hypothetical protein